MAENNAGTPAAPQQGARQDNFPKDSRAARSAETATTAADTAARDSASALMTRTVSARAAKRARRATANPGKRPKAARTDLREGSSRSARDR